MTTIPHKVIVKNNYRKPAISGSLAPVHGEFIEPLARRGLGRGVQLLSLKLTFGNRSTTLGVFLIILATAFSAPAQVRSTNAAAATNWVSPARGIATHDPSTIVKSKDDFWVFYTGRGVPSVHSKDLVQWTRGPAVFSNAPAWIAQAVPANRNIDYWAPDVIQVNNRFLLYYAVSTFGKNTSAIGLATNATLDPGDPAYKWADAGMVIQSRQSDDFNALDPAIFHDADGSLWLSFGSFWSGIRLVQLDPATGLRKAPNSPVFYLAHYSSIEASYIYQKNGYYYLFVNWGFCCRGANSTYNIRIGRSRTVTGPYLDKAGVNMLDGGGSLFFDVHQGTLIGPGHAGIIFDNNRYWFSCHFEADTAGRRGSPLAIMPLHWNADGWPAVDAAPPAQPAPAQQ
jgi:arabinan endo-1,5-alpha-L-arabinosidase